jgi:hypothetical protein
MELALESKAKGSRPGVRILRVVGVALAAPFLLGALDIGLKLVKLPAPTGYLTMAQLLGSGLLAFGLAIGILGSSFALTARSPQSRRLWSALTLFGCSHVLLAFAARRSVERLTTGDGMPLLPFAIPGAMWVCSVLLAVRAHGSEQPGPAMHKAESMEERPQPLSQP